MKKFTLFCVVMVIMAMAVPARADDGAGRVGRSLVTMQASHIVFERTVEKDQQSMPLADVSSLVQPPVLIQPSVTVPPFIPFGEKKDIERMGIDCDASGHCW